MIDQLERLKEQALRELAEAKTAESAEAWRIAYLGKKGHLTTVLRGVGALPAAERPAAGQKANEVKGAIEQAFADRMEEIRRASLALAQQAERIDVTLPGRSPLLGQVHPTTRIVKEILDAFSAMGFQVVEGPEVEWDYYNFEALNIPPDHPARDMWDTFYVAGRAQPGDMLLRTHTSPNQVRVMEKTQPPVRVVVPGKCYRYEAVDATHESEFF